MEPRCRTIRIRSDKMRWVCRPHHCAGFAEDTGDGMKDLYNRFETVNQFAISVTVCLELLGFVFKEVEDAFGRVTILE